MKWFVYFATLALASFAAADNHTQSYVGMNLQEGNALQLNLCKLQPRKTMADYERVFNSYIKWAEDNDAEVFALRGTPIFGGADANAPIEFEFIDFLVSPYAKSGDAWQKWLTTEQGQKINAQWQETAECRVSVNPTFIRFADREALSGDTRVMTINWCTVREGVTPDQLAAKHDSLMANRSSDSPLKAWSVMFPGLGVRNAPGDFAHFLSFADMDGLMAYQNDMANNEGWRRRADYERSYAECTGENVFHMQVLHRP
jgi:hypothetical protein